jgi:hypothetical protein
MRDFAARTRECPEIRRAASARRAGIWLESEDLEGHRVVKM